MGRKKYAVGVFRGASVSFSPGTAAPYREQRFVDGRTGRAGNDLEADPAEVTVFPRRSSTAAGTAVRTM